MKDTWWIQESWKSKQRKLLINSAKHIELHTYFVTLSVRLFMIWNTLKMVIYYSGNQKIPVFLLIWFNNTDGTSNWDLLYNFKNIFNITVNTKATHVNISQSAVQISLPLPHASGYWYMYSYIPSLYQPSLDKPDKPRWLTAWLAHLSLTKHFDHGWEIKLA